MEWINEPYIDGPGYSPECLLDCDLCFIYFCKKYTGY